MEDQPEILTTEERVNYLQERIDDIQSSVWRDRARQAQEKRLALWFVIVALYAFVFGRASKTTNS